MFALTLYLVPAVTSALLKSGPDDLTLPELYVIDPALARAVHYLKDVQPIPQEALDHPDVTNLLYRLRPELADVSSPRSCCFDLTNHAPRLTSLRVFPVSQPEDEDFTHDDRLEIVSDTLDWSHWPDFFRDVVLCYALDVGCAELKDARKILKEFRNQAEWHGLLQVRAVARTFLLSSQCC